ncbi:MAG: hypothetical protein DBX00_03275 [Verrucomicrobia bacterium]|nr:MAG: hypothetical protein DBX00_03275 [Verrucomicrobiota bacterium]
MDRRAVETVVVAVETVVVAVEAVVVAVEAATVVAIVGETVVDEAVIEISRRMTFLRQKKRSRFPLRTTDQVSEDLQASAPGFPRGVFIAAPMLTRRGAM